MNDNPTKLNVHVHPGSSRNMITGYTDGILNVKITARPEKGKANEALVTFLGDIFGIAKTRIKVQKGITSRNKLLLINGLNAEAILNIISKYLNGKES